MTNKPATSRNAKYQREVREQYRQFRVHTDELTDEEKKRLGVPEHPAGKGYWFNPVLDEDKDPQRNRLGYKHGDLGAYLTAGCHCPGEGRCLEANKNAQAEADKRRLEKVLTAHRLVVAEKLRLLLPGMQEGEAERVAAVVVSTGERVRRDARSRMPELAYREHLVMLALRAELGDVDAFDVELAGNVARWVAGGMK